MSRTEAEVETATSKIKKECYGAEARAQPLKTKAHNQKNGRPWTGGRAPQFRALIALVEDLGSVSSPHGHSKSS